MSSKNLVAKLFEMVYNRLINQEFVEESKMHKEDFTRKRKLTFAQTVLLIFGMTGKSIRSGIQAFFETYKAEELSYSNQAFSKGRMRINFTAFIEILRLSVEHFYSEAKPEKYRGYRVCAVDGTRLNLPTNEESKKEFGIQKETGGQIQALGSCLYDVQNKIIIDAAIAPNATPERDLAKKHLDSLESIIHDKELVLFDRGYPSVDLIKYIEQKGFKYLMRCSSGFIKGIRAEATSDDCVIDHHFKRDKEAFKLRYIKLTLSTGAVEYLITNILDKSFKTEDFKQLYHMRWEIETNYDNMKNKLQIENFSGTSPLAVKQDFYATMFLWNMVAMMVYENKDEVDRLHNSGDNKYHYVANVNNVVSLLKRHVIELLYTEKNGKRRKLLKYIGVKIAEAVVPKKHGRSNPRDKQHDSNKFPQNQRA